MKEWIKSITKLIVFLLGFTVLFMGLQSILHYRWLEKEDIYTTNIHIKESAPNDYDVLIIGSSETKCAFYPAVMYAEKGIRTLNYAVTNKSAMVSYYQLLYALRYLKPKVVCCDFSSLYDDCLPSERESIYRKMVDTMPDSDLKRDMISDIHDMDSTQSVLSYYFPMLRYHSIWSELTEENFTKDYEYHAENLDFNLGSRVNKAVREDASDFIMDDGYWSSILPEEVELSEISRKWYDKLIALCNENNIKIVATISPAVGYLYDDNSRWSTTEQYLKEHDVDILMYNNRTSFERLGLSYASFSDYSHPNFEAGMSASKALAQDLCSIYELPDSRESQEGIKWNIYWEQFYKSYFEE